MHLEASNGRSWQWARQAGRRTDELPAPPSAGCGDVGWFNGPCEPGGGSINRVNLEALRYHARASILDVNDGIISAAGIAEGFISAGASTRTLLLAGAVVMWPADPRRQGPASARCGPSGRWTVRCSERSGRALRRIPPANSMNSSDLRGQGPEPGTRTPSRRSPYRTASGGCPRGRRTASRGSRAHERGCPRRFDRGPQLRHSARSDDAAAPGRAAGIDVRRHPLRPRADGLVRGMADRAAGDQAGTPQYRARKCSHGGRHPCGFGPGLSYLAQSGAVASASKVRHRELHIADVILAREKYGNQTESRTARWKAPAGSLAQSAREHAFRLRASLFTDVGESIGYCLCTHANWYFE
jgi:hypothetical protein